MKELFLFKFFKSDKEKEKIKQQEKIEYIKLLVSKEFKFFFDLFHKDHYELKTKYQIHLITVIFDPLNNFFNIEITLGRPGIFIGKQGSNFKRIETFILPKVKMTLEEFDKKYDVSMTIKEFDPLSCIYEYKAIKNYEDSQNN